LSASAAERQRAVSAAKIVINTSARFIAQSAVQIHGGMGMTDELRVGHYFKRLTAIEHALGDSDHHLARYLGARARAGG
jgi:alkylation response protein AidB-like acyl-CoA dehydrogenase